MICLHLGQNFYETEAIVLSRLGRTLFSYNLRELMCLYYGLLIENISADDRRKLDEALDGSKASVSDFDAFDAELAELGIG